MKLRTALVIAAYLALPLAAGLSAHASEEGETAQVSGPWITLGDVADASGPLARIRVAPSPAQGETLALDPAYVARIARDNGVYFPADRTAPVRVARVGSAPDPAQPSPSAPRPPARPSPEHVLVLARDVARGDVVGVNDLEWAGPDSGLRAPYGAPEAMAEIAGQEAKRSVRAGRPVRGADFQTASVIKKGEPVTLVYAKGGLKLSVGGRALADAAMGEPVRVMNNYSKRAIDAVASGSGEARVAEF